MIPGSDSIVHQSPMIIYTNSKMNIMNISKNGKIKGSLSRGNLKLSLKVEEKELTEDFKKEEQSYKESTSKVDSEFWEDCNELKEKKIEDINTSKEDYLTFNETKACNNQEKILYVKNQQIINEKKNHFPNVNSVREEKFKKLLDKFSDSLDDKSISKKSQQATLRCNELYEQGKKKNEVNRLINQKNSFLKEQKEMSECTFKPKTNYIYRKKSINDCEFKGIYDRAITWKKRKFEKIDREKATQLRLNEGFAYKPQLNKARSQIFDSKKNLANDFSSRNFLMRLENARMEEKMKKEILNNGVKNMSSKWILRSQNDINNSNINLNLDLNSANIGEAIKNLHNELHNFNIDDDDDDQI